MKPQVGDLRTVTQRFDGEQWVLCLQSMPPRELSDEEKEKAKTRILANPDVEQSHLTSNKIISQPVAYMETDSLLKWLIPVYPPKGTQLYTAPKELSDKEILEIADNYWLEENYQIIEFVKSILKKANNG
jgi:hypothetical protein